jgi:hypothetical protein
LITISLVQSVFLLRGTGGGKPPTGNALKVKTKRLFVKKGEKQKQKQKTKQKGV